MCSRKGKSARFEASEVERGQPGNGFAERLKVHPILNARQGEVRREGAGFGLDSESRRGAIGSRGQRVEPRRFNAAPEYARRMRVGEEPNPANVDGDRGPRLDGRQRRSQIFDPRLRPLADELGGDVEVGRWTPVNARRGAKPIQQLFEAVDRPGRQIQSGKQSHGCFHCTGG